VEFAVEFAQEGALAVRHIADGVQMLADQVGLLLVAPAIRAEDVGESLSRLFQAPGGAMLRLGLRQQVQSDDEESVDRIGSSIQGSQGADDSADGTQ